MNDDRMISDGGWLDGDTKAEGDQYWTVMERRGDMPTSAQAIQNDHAGAEHHDQPVQVIRCGTDDHEEIANEHDREHEEKRENHESTRCSVEGKNRDWV